MAPFTDGESGDAGGGFEEFVVFVVLAVGENGFAVPDWLNALTAVEVL